MSTFRALAVMVELPLPVDERVDPEVPETFTRRLVFVDPPASYFEFYRGHIGVNDGKAIALLDAHEQAIDGGLGQRRTWTVPSGSITHVEWFDLDGSTKVVGI